VIVALVSGDEGIEFFRGIAMTLWIIGIHFIEAKRAQPQDIGTAAKIHPVLVIFSLFLGEHAYGLVARCSRCQCCRRSPWFSCTSTARPGGLGALGPRAVPGRFAKPADAAPLAIPRP